MILLCHKFCYFNKAPLPKPQIPDRHPDMQTAYMKLVDGESVGLELIDCPLPERRVIQLDLNLSSLAAIPVRVLILGASYARHDKGLV